MKYTTVKENERGSFIPMLVADDLPMLMRFENFIFSKLEEFTDDYTGGYFDFIVFENGAKAIVCGLDDTDKLKVKPQPNYFEGESDLKSLCMAANLFACSLFSFSQSKGAQSVGNNYHLLMDALSDDFDLNTIFGILD